MTNFFVVEAKSKEDTIKCMACGQNNWGQTDSHYDQCKDEDDFGVEITCKKEDYKSCIKVIYGKYAQT